MSLLCWLSFSILVLFDEMMKLVLWSFMLGEYSYVLVRSGLVLVMLVFIDRLVLI